MSIKKIIILIWGIAFGLILIVGCIFADVLSELATKENEINIELVLDDSISNQFPSGNNGDSSFSDANSSTTLSKVNNDGDVCIYANMRNNYYGETNSVSNSNNGTTYESHEEETPITPSVSSTKHSIVSRTLELEPTCTERGYYQCTCSCGYSYEETIRPLGHEEDENHLEIINQKCVREGCKIITSYDEIHYCKICNSEINYVSFMKVTIDHINYESLKEVSPTCITEGRKAINHCLDCDGYFNVINDIQLNCLLKDITLNKISHSVKVDDEIAPTYVSTGLTYGEHCPMCEKIYIEQEVISCLVNEQIESIEVSIDVKKINASVIETNLTQNSSVYISQNNRIFVPFEKKNTNSFNLFDSIKLTSKTKDNIFVIPPSNYLILHRIHTANYIIS